MDDSDDYDLFRRELDGVKPLQGDTIEPVRKRLRPVPGQRHADDARVMDELAEASPFDFDAETGDELLFVRDGVHRRLLRRLRRGQYSIGAALDLHGKTVSEARLALGEFLQDCRNRGIRGVRIIHGKGLRSPGGRPVIKGQLDRWLRHRDEVVAFCSARQVDGGTGAIYVLLKA